MFFIIYPLFSTCLKNFLLHLNYNALKRNKKKIWGTYIYIYKDQTYINITNSRRSQYKKKKEFTIREVNDA